ncbi:S49 family peptidase [Oceanospirillum sediminis]|uniref:S49 family peptidase n=1 Tax=Oceanospirillum sediminis TaxID=2760088 RepID=A0A839IX73_9GAMM|nr:S49 family peptidase [Oceanospirillum sediminis]MBB1489392.1 S49 family peptidase [Oceanospirillum sediminis]
MNNFPHLSARVLNQPLLLEPGYARVFFSALADRLGIARLTDAEGEVLTGQKIHLPSSEFRAEHEPAEERYRPYELVKGAAVLPVSGSLRHKYGYVHSYSGSTGYDGIIHRAADAFSDPDVKGVLMDMDTPGGEVAGCFDTAQTLRQMADQSGKPLWALCCDMNCSAGMALASAAHRRLITQTGVAGSVGVVMAHTNYGQLMDKAGIEVTLIHSGANKVAGNPYQSLSEQVLADFQSSTDQLRLEFAQLVAGFTGLSVEAVLATEAATYRGKAALEVGFADELINGHDALLSFTDYLSSSSKTLSLPSSLTTGNTDMTQQTQTPAATTQVNQTDPAQPAQTQTAQTQTTQATAPAEMTAAQMQARIAGILGLEAAATHQATAQHLAFHTQLSMEEAKGILATLPEASSQDRMSTSLDKVMSEEKQPDIPADGNESAGQSPGNTLLADYELATGDK